MHLKNSQLNIITVIMIGACLHVNADNLTTNDYSGLWLTEDDETIINIIQCNQSLCGRIEGFVAKQESNSNINHNYIGADDASLQQLRHICSTNIVGGFKLEKNIWTDGWIKDFEHNKLYSAELTLINKNKLKMTAYQGLKFFGESFIWNRVDNIQISCQLITNEES